MLDPAEQALFRQLSVLPDALTLEAAEARGERIASVLDEISSLVDKNLLRRLDSDSDHPFGMLAISREYDVERLDECGNGGAVRQATRPTT